MRKNDGLLLGWPYKSCGGKDVVDFENPIIDKDQGHIFTSALTGEGKGVSYSIPALLSWPGSVVAVDIKGELCEVTARQRLEMGQDVYVLDPFQNTGFKSDQLNPLDILKKDDPALISTATELFALMVGDIRIEKDPYWHQSAKSLLTATALQLLNDVGEQNFNFEDVGDRIDNPYDPVEELEIFHIFKMKYDDVNKALVEYKKKKEEIENAPTFINRMKNSEHRIVRKTGHTLNWNKTTTIKSIQMIASEAIAIAEGGQISQTLSKTTIPLNDIITGKPMTIYIVIPPEKLISHNKILRMWLGLIFSLLSKRRNWSGHDTLLMIDEAAQLGHMNELITAKTLLRSYGVKVWSIWQDLNQLQSIYPNEWQTILNGCRTQLWFGFTNGLVASQAAEVIEGFTKDELLNMDYRDAVIVRSRHKPEIIRRPDYLRHDVWKDTYDKNPYYAIPQTNEFTSNIENISTSI